MNTCQSKPTQATNEIPGLVQNNGEIILEITRSINALEESLYSVLEDDGKGIVNSSCGVNPTSQLCPLSRDLTNQGESITDIVYRLRNIIERVKL